MRTSESASGSLTSPSSVDASTHRHLFAALYRELRRVAEGKLQRKFEVTLSPTTLLHETYLNMARRDSLAFGSRAQFMSYASRAMRGLLIDYLRGRQAQKRGGELEIVALQTDLLDAVATEDLDSHHLERLHEALESLGQVDARLAECVDLRFFCGLSFDEIAQLRGVSERTVQRDWEKARVLLDRFINDREEQRRSA